MLKQILTNEAGIKVPKGATSFYTVNHSIVFTVGTKILTKRLRYKQQEALRSRRLLGTFGWSL